MEHIKELKGKHIFLGVLTFFDFMGFFWIEKGADILGVISVLSILATIIFMFFYLIENWNKKIF